MDDDWDKKLQTYILWWYKNIQKSKESVVFANIRRKTENVFSNENLELICYRKLLRRCSVSLSDLNILLVELLQKLFFDAVFNIFLIYGFINDKIYIYRA